ncbi:MAG: translation initiation factor IF-2 [Opitutaceae bacterium]|jgi:translation initiation factor IF-2
MSIRIHELAKKHNMEGREMLALLKERGYVAADTKSVSSTVSKIYVEEIEKEFAAKAPPELAAAKPAPAPSAPAAEPAKPRMPVGIFVKTAQDVARERETVAKASAAARPSAPIAKAPSPPPPRPVSPPRAAPAAPLVAPPVAVKAPVAAPPPRAPSVASAHPYVEPPKTSTAPPPLPPRPPSFSRPLQPLSPSSSAAPVVTVHGDVKIIHLKPPVIVRDFAVALSLKPFKLISELNQIVGFASMNSTIDEAVAQKVAEKYGFILDIKHRGDASQQQQAKDKEKVKRVEDESKDMEARPPVVVILGHVDHGKTTLLDAIRKANVAAGEAGGITQHIGAYQVEYNGRKITFLDTPGHAAFNKMRARGASVTDIAVLVVAADDGFMPQTDEALEHARNAKVVVIVAVNKMDVKGANLDQVKGQMQQRGIAPEDWGGETITVPVSAVKGTGLTDLLEMILLQADVLELKANPKAEVSGVVIESQVDVGRGPLSTVIVQKGTLHTGDAIVCGTHWAKVRALYDDQGRPIKEAPPSMPVRVIGWSGTPDSGSAFRGAKNAREAENLAEEEAHRLKKEVTTVASAPKDVSVEQLFANIAATQQKVLKVIIKADVFGSAEAVRQILEGIKSAKVSLEIVSTDVGLVTKNDVIMAAAAGAVILGFSTKLENGVTPLAKHNSVRIETFDIIYELGDRVREMMADLLDPDIKEIRLGAAEVRATFPLAKGFVAGCLVTEGKVNRGALARLRRGREIVHEGKVATLKRFKDDANEVRAGLECGVKLDDFNGYQVGDVIECYDTQKVRASL